MKRGVCCTPKSDYHHHCKREQWKFDGTWTKVVIEKDSGWEWQVGRNFVEVLGFATSEAEAKENAERAIVTVEDFESTLRGGFNAEWVGKYRAGE